MSLTNLLTINDVPYPTPAGGISFSYYDEINEYISENRVKTIEVLRSGIVNIDIKYNGLKETDLHTLINAMSTVNSVTFYDSSTGTSRTDVSMRIIDICTDTDNKRYSNDISVWSLSFKLQEL